MPKRKTSRRAVKKFKVTKELVIAVAIGAIVVFVVYLMMMPNGSVVGKSY